MDHQQNQEPSNVEGEDNDNDNPNQWQPRRRLLRGRRLMARGNRDARPNATIPPTSSTQDANEIDEDQPLVVIASEDPPASSVATIAGASQEPVTQSEPAPADDNAHFLTSSTGGVMQVPEGIDPSFLAALPEEMREEVIAEHMRLVCNLKIIFINKIILIGCTQMYLYNVS